MTTSGTITYEPTALEIIQAAFKNLGMAQEGEALSAAMYQDGLRALNYLIQTWSAHPHLWTATEGTVTLVADDPSYVVSPRALRILECRYRLDGIDTPMGEFSRQEYYQQPNKVVSPSIPVNFYFDPKVANGTLYLWPAPSSQCVTAGYTVHFSYVRFLDIMSATNNTLDFPQQWIEPITWGVSKRLMTQYPVNDATIAQIVLAQAAETYDNLLRWDNEPASLYMQVETRWRGYA